MVACAVRLPHPKRAFRRMTSSGCPNARRKGAPHAIAIAKSRLTRHDIDRVWGTQHKEKERDRADLPPVVAIPRFPSANEPCLRLFETAIRRHDLRRRNACLRP